MNRRTFLVGVTAPGIASGLAGCLGSGSPGYGSDGNTTGDGAGPDDSARNATAGGVAGSDPSTLYDEDLPIDPADLPRGAPKDAIPAIVDPAFDEDWGPVDTSLTADDRVLGVVREGQARAYPLRILDWHEIVNDDLGGPLLVTYCPLCGSGMTAERRVNGEETTFGVSGYLLQSDLVMYDELTDSLWSQIMATAIHGDATGTTLTLVPSTLTTWGKWQDDHSGSEVLLPPPESGMIVETRPRNYARGAYPGYDESDQIGIGYNDVDDDRLHPKTQVVGVAADGEAVAYPFPAVDEEGVVNDRVGDLPVVVVAGPGETLYAYDRRVDGETLTFDRGADDRMTAGGSTWTVSSGIAVDGPHEGRRLAAASNATEMFWFAWVDFHPETEIYGE